jgi:alkylhydroperoxidase family enzyme
MARLPYARLDDPGIRDLVGEIVAQRGEVLHLYQMLLHSPPIAAGWLSFMTAVRQQATLSGKLRELIIIRIALLNDAPYEAEQHRPFALREGCSAAQIDALGDWRGRPDLFDEAERTALALTDQLTRDARIDDESFAAARARWDEREIVELVTTIASYNMVSRVLAALAIHSDDPRPAPQPPMETPR